MSSPCYPSEHKFDSSHSTITNALWVNRMNIYSPSCHSKPVWLSFFSNIYKIYFFGCCKVKDISSKYLLLCYKKESKPYSFRTTRGRVNADNLHFLLNYTFKKPLWFELDWSINQSCKLLHIHNYISWLNQDNINLLIVPQQQGP